MVDLALLQSVSYIAGALGVCVAAIYYAMNLRISQRNQELVLKTQHQTLETRKAQFYMQINQHLRSEESQRRFIDLIYMEWKDYDDFERKYGSSVNIDSYAKRFSALYEFNGVGYLLKDGLIDMDTAYSLADTIGLELWRKFEPIVREQRVRYNVPEMFADLEFLAAEIAKRLEKKGHSTKTGIEYYYSSISP